MIHLFINASAASAGGGVTYIRNLVPQLAKRRDVRATVLLNPSLRQEMPPFENVAYVTNQALAGSLTRFWKEQSRLPALIQRSGADVLISTGNFALRNSPVPQILLSRNSLYTSGDFYRDLLRRRHYPIWFETKMKSALAKQSIGWADRTVAPSQAFAAELHAWTGREIVAIHHGFDRETFFAGRATLPQNLQGDFSDTPGALRLLFVSHYNYYRNFETLLRAIPLLRQQLAPRPLKLFLTCKLRPGQNPGSYRTDIAAALLEKLGIRDCVVELGNIPYASLHHVYRACHIYVTPAYTETFAHPLVEAMACGLPVVASDLPVHREICGQAALYFDRFSDQGLAARVFQLAQSKALHEQLSASGLQRASEFSWQQHCAEILSMTYGLRASASAEHPSPHLQGTHLL